MLLFAALADPKSGEIRPPGLVWLMLAGFPAAIAAIFYMEFRLRNKREPVGSPQANRESRVGRRHKESDTSGKC